MVAGGANTMRYDNKSCHPIALQSVEVRGHGRTSQLQSSGLTGDAWWLRACDLVSCRVSFFSRLALKTVSLKKSCTPHHRPIHVAQHPANVRPYTISSCAHLESVDEAGEGRDDRQLLHTPHTVTQISASPETLPSSASSVGCVWSGVVPRRRK